MEVLRRRACHGRADRAEHESRDRRSRRDAAVGLLLAFAYPGPHRPCARPGVRPLPAEPGPRRGVAGPRRHSPAASSSSRRTSMRASARPGFTSPRRSTAHCSSGISASSIRTDEEVAWDDRAEAVVARRVRRLDALVLDERALPQGFEERARAAMIEGIRALGLQCLPWKPDLEQWRARVCCCARARPRRTNATPGPTSRTTRCSRRWTTGSGPGSTASRVATTLRASTCARRCTALLDWNRQRQLDELAPTHLVVPSGSRIAVDYTGAAPTLAVRLQEVFGWRTRLASQAAGCP